MKKDNKLLSNINHLEHMSLDELRALALERTDGGGRSGSTLVMERGTAAKRLKFIAENQLGKNSLRNSKNTSRGQSPEEAEQPGRDDLHLGPQIP